MKQLTLIFIITCSTLTIAPATASAQRVSLFSWHEQGALKGEAWLGADTPVVNAEVFIIDPVTADTLRRTRTSSDGSFSFPNPPAIAMEIIVLAGHGHRASFSSLPAQAPDKDPNPGSPKPGPAVRLPIGIATGIAAIAAFFFLLHRWKQRHAR